MTNREPTIQQLFNLTGRVALVTGGAGWLGQTMASGLAEAGCRIVLTSRDAQRAREAACRLPAADGTRHVGVALDQMDPASIQDAFDQAVAATGAIDILVANGLEPCTSDWTDVGYDAFVRHQQNNAGYFDLARRVRAHVVARRKPASIVFVGSMYGVVASYPDAYQDVCAASSVAYQVLKGGTIQMTRHLAAYWARDGVRVNCLSPGPFPQDSAPAEMVRRLESKSPLSRMGRPHELKGALLLLASDAGSYITGHNLLVDGGWTAW